MNVLLYWAAVITLARSVAVQEYEHTTSEAPARTTLSEEEEEVQSPSGRTQYDEEEEEEEDVLGLYTPPQEETIITQTISTPFNLANDPGRPTSSFSTVASDSEGGSRGGQTPTTTTTTITATTTGSSIRETSAGSSIISSVTTSKLSLPPLPPLRVYHRPPPIRILRRIPTTPLPQPYFDPSSPTNISAQLGMHAFLPCTIRNLHNNSISWIRSRDSHILTVDRYTFIADERFQSWHEEATETWTLQVKYVQERDDGRYECQISTEPKMSHFVHFHVVTPLVHIPGGPDIYVKSGSTVTLKCVISGALMLPEYIFWYQGTDRVLAQEVAGGRQVFVERISDDTTIGTLIITTASPRDQGSYTCVPASLQTASVTLHVLNAGEHPAAMHHGGGPLSQCPPPCSLLLFCLLAGWLWGERSTSSCYIIGLLNLLPR